MMINNVNILTIIESLLLNVIKILPTIYQNKTKVPGKKQQVLGLIIRRGNCINCAQAI